MFMHARFASTLAIGAVVACSAAAQAADNIRYISITGDNANACTLAAPCRTLRRGINATPQGGELRVLDSGDYGGNVNVNRSMTISGNGHTLFLNGSLDINQAGVVVALRDLVLNGQGTVPVGISITAADIVHIERCVIHSFVDQGINATATLVAVHVLDSISRDNGDIGFNVVGAGAAQVSIDNSRFENNAGAGIGIQSGRAVISRSIASGNLHGIFAQGGIISVVSTTSAYNSSTGFGAIVGGAITIESSISHGNLTGVLSNPGNTIRISNSTIVNNNTGIVNNGVVETRSNNTVRGNTLNVAGSNALTPVGGI